MRRAVSFLLIARLFFAYPFSFLFLCLRFTNVLFFCFPFVLIIHLPQFGIRIGLTPKGVGKRNIHTAFIEEDVLLSRTWVVLEYGLNVVAHQLCDVCITSVVQMYNSWCESAHQLLGGWWVYIFQKNHLILQETFITFFSLSIKCICYFLKFFPITSRLFSGKSFFTR